MASEAKDFHGKLAKREKADTASKFTPEGREEHASAADKRLSILDSELFSAKTSRLRLAEVATRSEADDSKARTELQDAHASLVNVKKETDLAQEGLD